MVRYCLAPHWKWTLQNHDPPTASAMPSLLAAVRMCHCDKEKNAVTTVNRNDFLTSTDRAWIMLDMIHTMYICSKSESCHALPIETPFIQSNFNPWPWCVVLPEPVLEVEPVAQTSKAQWPVAGTCQCPEGQTYPRLVFKTHLILLNQTSMTTLGSVSLSIPNITVSMQPFGSWLRVTCSHGCSVLKPNEFMIPTQQVSHSVRWNMFKVWSWRSTSSHARPRCVTVATQLLPCPKGEIHQHCFECVIMNRIDTDIQPNVDRTLFWINLWVNCLSLVC